MTGQAQDPGGHSGTPIGEPPDPLRPPGTTPPTCGTCKGFGLTLIERSAGPAAQKPCGACGGSGLVGVRWQVSQDVHHEERFAEYRDALGMLKEDGVDAAFVQAQVAHRYQSTTAIYTGVNGDFMNTMRKALDKAVDRASIMDAGNGP